MIVEPSKDIIWFTHERRRGQNDGGPPEPPEMDYATRISSLESFAADARERTVRVETKIDHIGTEVSQMKWWFLGTIVTMIVTVLGTSVAIQQMTVATFQAAGQAQQPAQPTVIVVPAAAAPASR